MLHGLFISSIHAACQERLCDAGRRLGIRYSLMGSCCMPAASEQDERFVRHAGFVFVRMHKGAFSGALRSPWRPYTAC